MANIAQFVDNGRGGRAGEYRAGISANVGRRALTLRLVEDLEAARTAWEAFEERAVAMPFQSYAWLSAWVKANRNNGALRPLVVFGYEDGRLAVILPLAVERVFGIRRLVWLGQQFSDYNAPLIDAGLLGEITPKQAAGLVAQAGKLAGGADYALLAKQPEMLGGRPNPFVLARSYEFTCGAHYVELGGDWETFEKARMSSKSRRRLREKANKLAQFGKVEYVEATDPDERARLIDRLVDWKVAQLRARGDRVPFADPVARDFLARAVRHCEGPTPVRIFALKCGGRPISIALCLNGDNRLVYYMCGYEIGETTRRSPGLLLLIHLFRQALEEGIALFDFSNGDEEYKDRWADGQERIMVSGRAFTPLGLAGLTCERARLELIRAIKRSDRAMALARRLIWLGRGGESKASAE